MSTRFGALGRSAKTARICGAFLAMAWFAVARAPDLHAQRAGTLAPLDPVYEDLSVLDAAGLVPRGLSALRPLSFARVELLVKDARSLYSSRGPARDVSLAALLDRLEGRFGPQSLSRADVFVEVEAGGGESPARATPTIFLGGYQASVNPLWGARGGRAYGDRATVATAARITVPLGGRAAIGLGARWSAGESTGLEPVRMGSEIESFYLRVRLGRVALQAGRDSWWHNTYGGTSLLLSREGPPMNLVRVGSDRPSVVYLLGDVEWAFTAADTGERAHFPNTGLFGFAITSRPHPAIRFGLTLANKQFGEGAPTGSISERIKDLSVVWDLFRRNAVYTFSDKRMGLDALVRFDAGVPVEVAGEIALEDFDHERMNDVLTITSGYRLAIGLPRLGVAGRHGLYIEGERAGALMYRHHQFVDGHSVDGFPLGSSLGPDGRRVVGRYVFRDVARGFRAGVEATWEHRGIDAYDQAPPPDRDISRSEILPRETRLRLMLSVRRQLGSRSGLEFLSGPERVSGFGHISGVNRTNFAALVRVWSIF